MTAAASGVLPNAATPAPAGAASAGTTASGLPTLTCPLPICSHSIGRRLSRKLAIFTMAVLSVLFAFSWFGIGMMVQERNQEDLRQRCELLGYVLALEAQSGGEPAVLQRLMADAPMRAHARLELWHADGRLFYRGEGQALSTSSHLRSETFEVGVPATATQPAQLLKARYTVDFSRDAAIGRRWAWLLVLATLASGALVSYGARWHVRRQLRPLNELAAQTRAITPGQLGQLGQRLALADPAEELQPWLTQFNALMDRLERAYVQLEGFNADVAHELRTPLATLIGQTELALSRERSADALRETLASNLEEMQRLAALVNDMLFLSQADRGATARRGEPLSLAALAAQVAEFHEATIDDAGLTLQIVGDAQVAVDEPLVKRALSNLIGNATRFATPGSVLRVAITTAQPASGAADPAGATHATGSNGSTGTVHLVVDNAGEPIAEPDLPRLFDRFFRADASRCCEDAQHHGLGLAIVAAIARMHGGQPSAACADGRTRIGFTLQAG